MNKFNLHLNENGVESRFCCCCEKKKETVQLPAMSSIKPNLHMCVNWTTTAVAININIAKLLKYDGYNVHTVDENVNALAFMAFAAPDAVKWLLDDVEHISMSMRFIAPIVTIDTMAAARRRIVMSLNCLLSFTNVSGNIWRRRRWRQQTKLYKKKCVHQTNIVEMILHVIKLFFVLYIHAQPWKTYHWKAFSNGETYYWYDKNDGNSNQ